MAGAFGELWVHLRLDAVVSHRLHLTCGAVQRVCDAVPVTGSTSDVADSEAVCTNRARIATTGHGTECVPAGPARFLPRPNANSLPRTRSHQPVCAGVINRTE